MECGQKLQMPHSDHCEVPYFLFPFHSATGGHMLKMVASQDSRNLVPNDNDFLPTLSSLNYDVSELQ
jgi:hypothetical protein